MENIRVLFKWSSHVQKVVAARAQEDKWSWSTFMVSIVQGKRNPSKKVDVARGHQRADTLKPYSQKTSQYHTRTTALSNSMKLSHALCGHPRWAGHGGEIWQNEVHWRREWQTTSVFLPWEPHEQYKRQNDRILKEELPRSIGVQCYWRSVEK